MGNAAAIASIKRMKHAVSQLSRVPSRAAKEASDDIRRLLFEQFVAQTDAYGSQWTEHKTSTIRRHGEHPIGYLTGDMLDIDVVPTAGAGIVVMIPDVPYLRFFTGGRTGQPARPILPTGALPDSWAQAINEASSKAFHRIMSRA